MAQAVDWQRDEDALNCNQCKSAFSFFVRRHHCRSCGLLFCGTCTAKTLQLYPSKGPAGVAVENKVRVCDGCFVKRTAKPSAKVALSKNTEDLIYQTKTICPRCSIIEGKGFKLKPASVFERNGRVWMRQHCDYHTPATETLVCKDAEFFRRILSFTEENKDLAEAPNVAEPKSEQKHGLVDVEDLDKRLELAHTKDSPNLPFVMEVTLFRDEEWVSDAEVDRQLKQFTRMYPDNHSFVLKINGGLTPPDEITKLNEKVLRIESSTIPGLQTCPLVVDLSFERLRDLAEAENTCLLRGRIFPSVRYFLTQSEEKKCIEELTTLMDVLSEISSIQLVLLLSVDRPYPDLTPIFDFLSKHKGIIRFIVISRERSPQDIFTRLSQMPKGSISVEDGSGEAQKSGKSDDKKTGKDKGKDKGRDGKEKEQVKAVEENTTENVDPVELLEIIQNCTKNKLQPKDYVPLRVGRLAEPLLALAGFGQFHFRPSAFCGLAACVINSEEFQGQPLSRIFDLYKLYWQLLPIVTKLEKGQEKVGIFTAKAVQKALQVSTLPGVKVPEFFSFVASVDDTKQQQLRQFMKNLQFVIVHNKMDFASVDIARRCSCMVLESSPVAKYGLAATCTGCI